MQIETALDDLVSCLPRCDGDNSGLGVAISYTENSACSKVSFSVTVDVYDDGLSESLCVRQYFVLGDCVLVHGGVSCLGSGCMYVCDLLSVSVLIGVSCLRPA